ncbi:hypothetical protein PsAD13_03764 [Pseudovibrio sp. Ad13]|uniref:hypothetical protein n=1 Tax=unclassified Pseudovibrio TaxID=2627060 RepID=UPI0007AE43B6|nr:MULTISPECIES: hypothetical protein [unclassified Pseudovibrio]KZK82206.1 hypothetical protein PsAD13_03764 [Pseudovibrio sp. Ad13]KZK96397.1 hypothetical protein PsAD5_02585 [Pseudovibrio sp. Ad5]
MAEFDLYEGIVQHSPKSCGAYCVNAALAQLGFMPKATDVDTLNAADLTKGYDVTTDPGRINLWRLSHLIYHRLQIAEVVTTQTYKVSGNLELDLTASPGPTALYKENDGTVDLENSPSGMVAVAKTLAPGLAKNITYYTAFGKGLFNNFKVLNAAGGYLFNREEDLIQNKLGKTVSLSNVTSIPFQTNQVNLILVQYAGTNTMHWVAGTRHLTDTDKAMIYDPATGDVLEIATTGNFKPQTSSSAKPATQIGPNSYEFPGIWIRLGA